MLKSTFFNSLTVLALATQAVDEKTAAPKIPESEFSASASSQAKRAAAALEKNIVSAIGGTNVTNTEAGFQINALVIERKGDETKFTGDVWRIVDGRGSGEIAKFELVKTKDKPPVFVSEIDERGSIQALLAKPADEIRQWVRDGGTFRDGTWAGAARHLFACMAIRLLQNDGVNFTRATVFDSIESFVIAARLFQPAKTKGDLAEFFRSRERLKDEDMDDSTPATETLSSAALWSSDKEALVFVNAKPPTEGMPSAVGVLFLLTHQGDGWRVKDLLRFTASGKYAGVTAEQTAGSDFEYYNAFGSVTVRESHGGRGVYYHVSATYTIRDGKLKRMEME